MDLTPEQQVQLVALLDQMKPRNAIRACQQLSGRTLLIPLEIRDCCTGDMTRFFAPFEYPGELDSMKQLEHFVTSVNVNFWVSQFKREPKAADGGWRDRQQP